jgi:beta-glucosidase/6-phospho-beta-glucosidase/beta-galactosidase
LTAALAIALGCGDNDDPVDLPPPVGEFPDDFLWGTAIAPYQVEGGLHDTDWYRWESLCGSGCSGDSADDGPDFLGHYQDDFDAARAIGNNAIRLGIDWSRIFPTEASFPDAPDADAVAMYHQIIDAAHDRDMQVMVTLVHFALPTWVHDMDDPDAAPGWEGDAIIERLGLFAAWAGAELGDDVDLWITLNEPFVNVVGGWVSGDVPPGKAGEIELALAVGERMIRAHAAAYDGLHATDTGDADGDGEPVRVSIAQHSRIFVPKDPDNPKQVRAADTFRYLLNDYFLNGVVRGDLDRNYDGDADDEGDIAGDPDLAGRLDYIGLNYYGVTVVLETANEDMFPIIGIPLLNDLELQGFDAPKSDFGWAIYAPGLRQILDELTAYQLPILITENGVADATDVLRPRFLVEHLYQIADAIDDGVDVEGYFHWALMDNFEWGSGYCPRFGLLRVDFADPARPRTAGAGADVYRRIIEDGTVDPALFGDHEYGQPGYCPRLSL